MCMMVARQWEHWTRGDLPVQVRPSPASRNPVRHEQRKLPGVLVQM